MAALLLALAVVLLGLLTLKDALAVRDELNEARTILDAATGAFAAGDASTAAEHLETADELVQAADRRTTRPWWRLAAAVPLAGRSFVITQSVTDLAVEAVKLGRQVVEHASPLLGAGGDVPFEVSGGVIDLQQFVDVQGGLEAIETKGLARSVERLTGIETTWVPEEVRAGQRDALRMGHRLLRTVEVGQSLVEVLPGFLGAEGPRHYFLAMQNPGELRGTGGLIGLWSILTIDGGRFEITEPERGLLIDGIGREAEGGELPPVETSLEFEDRYGSTGAAGFFSNVNIDPHLPLTGGIILDLFQARMGQALDGVIVLDPIGLEEIISVTGPVTIEEDVDAPGLPLTVQPADVAELALVDVYYAFPELGEQEGRHGYLESLVEAAFDRVFDGDWNGIAMADRLSYIAGRRNLQLYSTYAEEQAVFERAGVAGDMAPRTETDDFLSFTGINSAANKADVHVAHRLTARMELSRDGSRRAEVGVEIENPLPTDGPQYVVGSAVPVPGEISNVRGEDGLTRTWTTIWAPSDSEFIEARSDDGEQIWPGTDLIHGHRAFDHTLEVPSESIGGYEVEYRGPAQLSRDGPDLVYRLTLWRQAKAIPDHVDLSLKAPDGWSVAEAHFEGGGDGKGMGVGGDGTPLQIEHDGITVRVQGAMTRDAHVEVRFTRGLWDRFEEWLRQPAF